MRIGSTGIFKSARCLTCFGLEKAVLELSTASDHFARGLLLPNRNCSFLNYLVKNLYRINNEIASGNCDHIYCGIILKDIKSIGKSQLIKKLSVKTF